MGRRGKGSSLCNTINSENQNMRMLFDKVNKRLEVIFKTSKRGGRIKDLSRLMNNPAIWFLAYQNIYPNKGAMTKGIDHVTMDGMSKDRVINLIRLLKQNLYRSKPVRRVYIPKPNGKKRPLGIPSGDEKLIQEVVKIILNAIYEPIFSNNSHGFRNERSCHTALKTIKFKWSGVKWLIDFDIKGYFDNINHKLLLKMLEKRIDDKKFINLIRNMLRAGYLEDWKFHRTYSGAPQGGICSPVLANIYLHELDIFIEELIRKFNKGKKRRVSPEYHKLKNRTVEMKHKIEQRKAEGEDYRHLVEKLRKLQEQYRSIPSTMTDDPNYKRLRYCRYADDFVLGVIGSKEEAKKVKTEIENFIHDNLKLEISAEKTGIRYSKDGTVFLGYEIRSYSNHKTVRTRVGGRFAIKRCMRERMQLHIPRTKLYDFNRRHKFGNLDTMKFKHKGELINHSDFEIISYYNGIMRGFANYYSLAQGAKSALKKVMYIAGVSLVTTLAAKHKCSAIKVRTRILNGKQMTYKYEHNGKTKKIKVFDLKQMRIPYSGYWNMDLLPARYTSLPPKSELLRRILAEKCEYCSKEKGYFEVHHVRKLADIKGKELWERVMIARRRKTMILCAECHDLLHAGKLPDGRFKRKYA
jgi:RNA-directed DNA polymerase